MSEDALKRRIGLPLLTAYGVGVMVGAGIYVLVGAVVADAGAWAPLSFLLAGLIAAPTALSYAEFSTRLPEAAGEAVYVGNGLNSDVLALIVGLAIVVAGTVSAGAVLRGGVGYLTNAFPIDQVMATLVIGGALCAVAIVGVLESLALAAVFTAVEIAGLSIVVWAGFSVPATPDWTAPEPMILSGLGLGAVLAFFAFIGFEDIVNMAEEVDQPERTLPRAILISLIVTTVIYALVTWAAVRAVPLDRLAGSESPLALVWSETRGGSAAFLSLIAVFAALNGVLAQIVMASRVLFGLGKRTPALGRFHHASPRFGTPVLATVLIGILVLATALTVPLATLAEVTSAILLGVFALVNLALLVVKQSAPEAAFRVPVWVPAAGLALSLAALAVSLGAQL